MHPRNRNVSPVAPGTHLIGTHPRRGSGLSWVVFLMFLTLIVLFIPPDLAHPDLSTKSFGAPDPTVRTIKFALLGLSAIIILSRLRLSLSLLKSINSFFIVFLVLIPLSRFWSIEPSATIARYVSLFTVVVVCYSIALVNWNRCRFQQVVRPILTLFLLGSLIVGIIWPEVVLEKGNDISLKDSWHGLASQKNEFGQIASFGVIVWFHAWLTREVKRVFTLFGLGISVACVFLSRSSTALLASVLSVGVLLLLQRPPPALRRYMPYLVGLFTGLSLTYALAVLNLVPGLGILLEPFTALSGKDMTFSNRVLIWQIIKEHIQLSPILGSGYGAYWVGPVATSPSNVFISRMYIYPTQSHNGFLEVTNDLGFVGLIFLLGYLIAYVRQCLGLMKFDRALAALYLAIVFQQVIINLSEAAWITARSASSNLMILATICLARALLEQRRQGASSIPRPQWSPGFN
jgi:exopolysaccharide production protein ExoQ